MQFYELKEDDKLKDCDGHEFRDSAFAIFKYNGEEYCGKIVWSGKVNDQERLFGIEMKTPVKDYNRDYLKNCSEKSINCDNVVLWNKEEFCRLKMDNTYSVSIVKEENIEIPQFKDEDQIWKFGNYLGTIKGRITVKGIECCFVKMFNGMDNVSPHYKGCYLVPCSRMTEVHFKKCGPPTDSPHFKINDPVSLSSKPLNENAASVVGYAKNKEHDLCYVLEISINNGLQYIVLPKDKVKHLEHAAGDFDSIAVEGHTPECYDFHTITDTDILGIQGNRNSCYLDTSIFVMFGFQSGFDMLISRDLRSRKGDIGKYKELSKILATSIVYPLRKYHQVDCKKVEQFRMKLNELFPTKNFLIHEKDPEELLETLFNAITPNQYLFRTTNSTGLNQGCFVLQLFYTTFQENTNISKMLEQTFIENRMHLLYPPKHLILQLPRNSTDYKMYSEVDVERDLDVTNLIAGCAKCAEKDCGKNASKWCPECSKDTLCHYCEEHLKDHTEHNVLEISKVENLKRFVDPVILGLYGILCIEKTHYTAYIKTNEVDERWIYFNSMEDLQNHQFIPKVRYTNLHKYFEKPKEEYEDDRQLMFDIDRIKTNTFVCFYKFPQLEPYMFDFNDEDKQTDMGNV